MKSRLVYFGFLINHCVTQINKITNIQKVHTYMQQNAISEVQQWLPEIDPCQIELANGSVEGGYRQNLNQITEKIRTWAMDVLEKANLPSAPNEAKALLEKYDVDSNEGCALHVVIELDAMDASIHNTDANTAAITGMKLFEAIWQHAVTTMHQGNADKKESKENMQLYQDTVQENEENLQLYQDTINELKKKYPHCNVNALRLLASTRLNVTKQRLDDLNISPQ